MGAYTKSAGSSLDVYLMGFRPGDGLVRNGPDTDCEFECIEGGISEDCTIPVTGCNNRLQSCAPTVQPIQCIPEVEACKDPCKTCGGGDSSGESVTAEEVTAMIEAQTPAIAAQCATDAIVAAAAEKA